MSTKILITITKSGDAISSQQKVKIGGTLFSNSHPKKRSEKPTQNSVKHMHCYLQKSMSQRKKMCIVNSASSFTIKNISDRIRTFKFCKYKVKFSNSCNNQSIQCTEKAVQSSGRSKGPRASMASPHLLIQVEEQEHNYCFTSIFHYQRHHETIVYCVGIFVFYFVILVSTSHCPDIVRLQPQNTAKT